MRSVPSYQVSSSPLRKPECQRPENLDAPSRLQLDARFASRERGASPASPVGAGFRYADRISVGGGNVGPRSAGERDARGVVTDGGNVAPPPGGQGDGDDDGWPRTSRFAASERLARRALAHHFGGGEANAKGRNPAIGTVDNSETMPTRPAPRSSRRTWAIRRRGVAVERQSSISGAS